MPLKKKVTLALEPMNRFETDFVNLAMQAVEIIKEVNSPACKVHLDTFHMNIEEKDMMRAIEETGDYLGYFHANENDRGIPGTGHIPWKEIARVLRKVNYQGPIVTEPFRRPEEAIGAAPALLQPSLEGEDVDAELRQALNFLRDSFG